MGDLANIIRFPLDMVFFTMDVWRITLDMVYYRVRRHYKDQPCIYCQSSDNGLSPRLLPARMRKYRNRRLAMMLQPCIGKGRIGKGPPRKLCQREGGYVTYPLWIPLVAILLVPGWGLIVFLVLWLAGWI